MKLELFGMYCVLLVMIQDGRCERRVMLNIYKAPKDSCGSFLCANDVPSQIVTANSRGQCALWCQMNGVNNCQRFNWKGTTRCELYYFEPSSYIPEDTCIYYIVSDHFGILFWNIIWVYYFGILFWNIILEYNLGKIFWNIFLEYFFFGISLWNIILEYHFGILF